MRLAYPIKLWLTQARTAVIVGGIHGSEQSGVEVANLLLENLRTGPRPHFTTIVVPVLFPANLAAAQRANPRPGTDPISPGRLTRGSRIDPNRQFPAIGESLTTARSRGGTRGPLDAEGRPVEPEIEILLELIQRFHPTRIASVHAHSMRGRPRRNQDMPGIFGERSDPTDDALALAMARRAASGGARVPGNWLGTSPEAPDYPPARQISPGTSLGEWGSHPIGVATNSPTRVPRSSSHPIAKGDPEDRAAMTIITVEVQHYHPSSAERTPAARRARLRELEAHRDALREIFLERP